MEQVSAAIQFKSNTHIYLHMQAELILLYSQTIINHAHADCNFFL